jgi:hypothetical protein
MALGKKEVKKIADVEAGKIVKGHEQRMHKGAKKMYAGGVTSEAMMKEGRNMARVANQRSGSRGR